MQVARQASGRRVVYRNEGIGRHRLTDVVLPSNVTFGVELETFLPSNATAAMLKTTLDRNAPNCGWKVKNDRSIVCNPNVPSCYKAELASPPLQGHSGLDSIYQVCKAVKAHHPSVNKSTGLHVHVGVQPVGSGQWQLSDLRRLAYNWVQMETAFDMLVPASRRSNINQYCCSNLTAVTANSRSKKDALQLIKNASSLEQLQQLVCPGPSRYFKLNLMALSQHNTVEFRHAGGSMNPAKIVGYVILYVSLAEASLDTQRALASVPKKGYPFENLLKFFRSSPVLVHWLIRRRSELNPKGTNGTRGAGRGSGCSQGCTCNECRASAASVSRR